MSCMSCMAARICASSLPPLGAGWRRERAAASANATLGKVMRGDLSLVKETYIGSYLREKGRMGNEE